jgi:hypothetical protein
LATRLAGHGEPLLTQAFLIELGEFLVACLHHRPSVGMLPPRDPTLYEVKTGLREEGWPSDKFVYDGEHDLYRMADGEFACSREYTIERLREEGFIG